MSAPYYILKPAVDTQETGSVFPAVETYPDYDFKGPNSMHRISKKKFTEFDIDLRFKLVKNAKLTDVLSQAAINAPGILISPQFKNQLEGGKVVPHEFLPVNIEDENGTYHDYFFLHLVWEGRFDAINFSDSTFYTGNIEDNNILVFSTASDFAEARKKFGYFNPIKPKKLILNSLPFNIILSPLKPEILIDKDTKALFESTSLSGLKISQWQS